MDNKEISKISKINEINDIEFDEGYSSNDGNDEKTNFTGDDDFGDDGDSNGDGDGDGDINANADADVDYNDDDDDDDDDDEIDEDLKFKKLPFHHRQNIIQQYHPQIKYRNIEEIEYLTTIIRNKDGKIDDPNHRTTPFMTKFERARILGERAKQFEDGVEPMIDLKDNNIINSYLIAEMELEQKKTPFIIERPIPNGKMEYWKISDLEFI